MGLLGVVTLSVTCIIFCIPILALFATHPREADPGLTETDSWVAALIDLGVIAPSLTLAYFFVAFIVCRERDGFRLFTSIKSQWSSKVEKANNTIPRTLITIWNIIIQALLVILWKIILVLFIVLKNPPGLEDFGFVSVLSLSDNKNLALIILVGVEWAAMLLLYVVLRKGRKSAAKRVAAKAIRQDVERGVYQGGVVGVGVPDLVVSRPIVVDRDIEQVVYAEKV